MRLSRAFHATPSRPSPLQAFWKVWQTALIVFLVVLGLPLWLWRMFGWLRKRRDAVLDLEVLYYGALFAVDVGSFALAGVLLVVSTPARPCVKQMVPCIRVGGGGLF